MSHFISNRGLGIYIHIPFCVRKCDYCDFYSIPVSSYESPELSGMFLMEFGRALRTELQGRLGSFSSFQSIDSIYFGGGTASIMPSWFVGSILEELNKAIPFQSDCEITLEGNAEHMTLDYLKEIRDVGVNRINVGIQSFNFVHLSAVNRRFHPERYATILDDLNAADIPHTGVDLMYGFPGQTMDDFEKDLRRVFSSGIDHLSLYSLTVESDTRYQSRIQSGLLGEPDYELQENIFKSIPSLIGDVGFYRYEVSNHSRRGSESRHNMRYWNYHPYMGLGPGAHGFDGRNRYGNIENLDIWLDKPLGALWEKHDPLYELPLGLLRLNLPIPLRRFHEVFESEFGKKDTLPLMESVYAIFIKWEENGFGRIVKDEDISRENGEVDRQESDEDSSFVWSDEGLLRLDDRILEMTEILAGHKEALEEKTSSSLLT